MQQNQAIHGVSMENFIRAGDDELLLYISLPKEDPDAARKAFSVFYNRHAEYLFNALHKKERDLFGDFGIDDVLQMTFLQVLSKAGQYQSGSVRAWLGTIANRVILSYFRRPDVKNREMTEIDEHSIPAANSLGADERRSNLFERALSVLDAREREVIRVSEANFVQGAKQQRLPNEISKNLAAQLGTTTENIRKIRQRAKEKLVEFVANYKEQHNGNGK